MTAGNAGLQLGNEDEELDVADRTFPWVHRARLWLQDSVSRQTIRTMVLICTWYILSTSLSLYNKQLLGKKHGVFGKGAFPAPLFMSSVQFLCQTALAKGVFAAGVVERTRTRPLPWREYGRVVVPNGIITGLDIGFSNTSLVFITMSFYTMCKATVPVFLLFFAFLWGIERPSWGLIGVVGVIVFGLTLLVKGESEFDGLGFGLVMTASCLSGLRFTLMQVILHGPSGHAPASGGHSSAGALGGPLEVLELLTPVMSATVLMFSLAWERLWSVLPSSPYFESFHHSLITFIIILAGGTIAFLMVWTEYQVIKETSALTFMIAGTVKEVVTVLAAVAIMGDKLTPVNSVGLCIVIVGVLLFNRYKYHKMKQGEIPVYTALPSAKEEDPDRPRAAAASPGSAGEDGVASGGGIGSGSADAPARGPRAVRAIELEPLLPLPAGVMSPHR